MIAKVLVSSKPPTVGLRPVGDSLPRTTWREAAGYSTPGRAQPFRYPTEGCHGAPLERECPDCKGAKRYVPRNMPGVIDLPCVECMGHGRVRVDHPNRTDGP